MNWLVFVFGVLVGWIIEWSIDLFFWRRRTRALAQSNAELESELSRVGEEKQELELQVSQQSGRETELESCKTDLARCRADLESKGNELQLASRRIVELSAEVDTRRTQLVKEEQRGDEFQVDLESRANELAVVSRELALTRTELDACRAERSAAQDRARTLEADLDAALASATMPVEPQSLQDVEGIGPKIQSILYSHGILSFRQLAATSSDRLRQILDEAGPQFRLADPSTWSTQAQLAADGDWDALEVLQDRLKGGRTDTGPALTQ